MSNVGFSSSSVGDEHTRSPIVIENGCLEIDGKRFRVSLGSATVTDLATLEKVKKMLESPSSGDISASIQEMKADFPTKPVKFYLKQEGVQFEGRQEVVPEKQTHKKAAQNYTAQIEKLGYTKEELGAAIASILQESHLGLISEYEGEGWGEKTVSDLLQEKGNEELRSALVHLSLDSGVAVPPSCKQDLVVFILSNAARNPKSMPASSGGTYSQVFYKGKGSPDLTKAVTLYTVVEKNKGLPSEADKDKYREKIENKNTNLGFVSKCDAAGNSQRTIVGRSGKSDTQERVQELVTTAALSHWDASHTGFTRSAEQVDGLETHEFQHVIDSYLDSSFLKSIPERLLQVSWNKPSTWSNLWKTTEYEIKYLETVMRSAERWPQEGIRLTVDKKENGKVVLDGNNNPVKVCIVLKKPIVVNQLLSTTLRGFGTTSYQFSDMGQRRSDITNFASRQQFLDLHLRKSGTDDQRKELDVARLKFRRLEPWNPARSRPTKESFLSPECAQYQRTTAKILLENMQKGDPTASALFACTFRRSPPRTAEEYDVLRSEIENGTFSAAPSPAQELHAADCEIYLNILMKSLNLSHSKQCKSGTDRTAIGVALAVAQDDFAAKFDGKEYIPDQMTREEELFFKMKFHHALEMARSMAVESKGYSGIKWGGGAPIAGGMGNPVPLKYLFNEQDILYIEDNKGSPAFKDVFEGEDFEFIVSKQKDVTGLTQSDLQMKGKVQYVGELVNPLAIYGKSELSHVKRLNISKARLSIEDRGEAEDAFRDFLVRELNMPMDKVFFGERPILQELEFTGDIRSLHLDEEGRLEKLEDKISELKNKQEISEVERLELYMFNRLVGLWKNVKQTDVSPSTYTFVEAE